MSLAITTRARGGPPGAPRGDVAAEAGGAGRLSASDAGRLSASDARAGGADAEEVRSELDALKLLIVAMWRELSALEAAHAAGAAGARVDLPLELRRFESDLIRCALIRTAGRQRRAARMLGMSVATLNAKIKRYRIDADEILNRAAALRLKNKQGARDVEE